MYFCFPIIVLFALAPINVGENVKSWFLLLFFPDLSRENILCNYWFLVQDENLFLCTFSFQHEPKQFQKICFAFLV
uniref:Secreted protein n=1 Tax=Rhizophora mucronata TaxID=61149 RepID=A0A2P2Q8Q7_RHIMU